MSEHEIERRDSGVGVAVRKQYDPSQVALIKDTVARGASDAELAMFLELSKRYELDPFAGQIWFTKMPGSNGESGRPAIIVGRDGFLTIANRHPDFEGFDSDVVRKNDTFRMERGPNNEPVVTHTYSGGTDERGDIVGAWCIVYRTGRRPRYFFAPYDEYVPKNERKLRYSPWGTQPSVMIEKCAITTALRLAFNITGLIGEEEASNVLLRDQSPTENFEYAEDPWLAARLASLFEAANELKEGAFRPAKIRLMLRGKTDAERLQVADELCAWIEQHGGVVPEPPEQASAEPEEGEQEAEVIVPEDEDVMHPPDPEAQHDADDDIPFAPDMPPVEK